MSAVQNGVLPVENCGINVILNGNGFVRLRNTRNSNSDYFDISVNDWIDFINKVKARTFRRIKSKPGVSRMFKYGIYIVLTYHGWIEFKYRSHTLTYHMSQKRCQEFFEDIRKGKFDLIK